MSRPRLALIALCLVLAGCQDRAADTPKHAFSWWRGDDIAGVRRVAVLPFLRGPKVGRSAEAVAPAFAAALRDLGAVQVVEVDVGDAPGAAADPVLHDEIAAADLLRLRDLYHVDAVLVGRIDHLMSYDPLAMDLSVHLVSCRDGHAVWSGSGSFDGRRADVQADIAAWYHHRQVQEGGTVLDWHGTLQSPGRFARYVADRMAATVSAPTARR
jgi:hypothetical protein